METNILKNWIIINILNEKGKISGKKLNSVLLQNKNIKEEIKEKTSFCPEDFPVFYRVKMILNNITEFKKCANCGIKNVSWNKSNHKILDYCSNKCASSHIATREKVKKTVLENFGVEHIMKSEKFKNQYKETCLKNHGVDNVSKLKNIKDKKAKTNLKNWGVKNVSQNEEIKKKKRKTTRNNFGVDYPIQNLNIKEKTKQTNLKIYKTKHVLQNEQVREKGKKTNLKKFGTEFPTKNKEVKQKIIDTKIKKYGKDFVKLHREKSKKTCLLKYGVEYPSQNTEIYKKIQVNSSKIHEYKNTSIFYQGSYEKYFLEQMEYKNLLSKVVNGKCYEYYLNGKKHKYHVDFLYIDLNIEIKSSWTYNKNGKDKKLELENENKWKAIVDNGDKIIVLFSKKQIFEFVQNQNINQ